MEFNYWRLKTELFTLQRQETALKEALAQAKYDLRNANAALIEYNGSFRSFLDKFSGKQEQRLYELNGEKKRIEARLDALQREQTDLARDLAEKTAQLEALPVPQVPDHRGEARYCIECLMVTLPEADEALTAMGELMRGAVPGQIITQAQRQEVYGEADRLAGICAASLKQLETALSALHIPFKLPDCYRNPLAYLANATDFTRRDRLNELVSQTIKLRKQLPDLLRQL